VPFPCPKHSLAWSSADWGILSLALSFRQPNPRSQTHPFLPLIATASIDSDFTVKLWRDTLSPSTSSSPLPLPPSTDNACALPSSASNGTAPQETVASIDIGQEAFDGQTEGKVSAGGVMEAMMARDADDVKMHEDKGGKGRGKRSLMITPFRGGPRERFTGTCKRERKKVNRSSRRL
jgi:hypothetical protein